MTNFYDRYYPTLCIRRAEMRAMEHLPDSEKGKMLPIVLLAPWLNSIKFDRTFEIIKKSIGDFPIIVDIDRYFQGSSPLPSRQYFETLCSSADRHLIWEELVESNENFIPSLQFSNVSRQNVYHQIDFFKKLGRGISVRIEIERDNDYDLMFDVINDLKDEDLIVILDYGYQDYSLKLESKVSVVINKIVEKSRDLKFVLSGADFPNDFSDFDNFSEAKEISSRVLYEQLAKRFGNYNFYYGDWASTKPRKYDGRGSPPRPRVDFPTRQRWIIARSKEDDWDFPLAAKMITRLPEWGDRPHIWGTGMIEKTAHKIPGGISTSPEAIAVRVNIHLFVQNNYLSPSQPMTPTMKWKDPIF